MNIIQQTIKSFLDTYDLNKPDLIYLVAFSGGFDSMCLLNELKKVSENRIIAIHLNHNWRGEESDNEEKKCKEFCKSIGVEFYGEKLATDIPHTETAARNERYKFFEKCSNKFKSHIIFTAHNKNDNAETLVYRLCLGTGTSGLQGITPHRDKFYRPLLKISRPEIEKYCLNNKLKPNTDSSNYDIKYKRNFIRAKIMPLLQEINSNAVEAINSLSEVAKEENDIITEYINKILDKITDNKKIKTSKFLNLSEAIQRRIIYNLFITNNLDYDRTKILNILNFIKENSNSKSGKTCSLTSNLWIFTSDKYIEIVEKQVKLYPYFHITKEGRYENSGYIFELEKFDKNVIKYPKETADTAYINLAHIPIDFEIRPRLNGDIIKPFGLNGTQKLKKYLNAKKIPNHEKDSLLFLAQGHEILWAINLGLSDKIKVVSKPTHRMKFYKKEGL